MHLVKSSFKNPAQWKNHEKSKKHRSTLLSMGIDPDAVEDYEPDEEGERVRLTEQEGGEEGARVGPEDRRTV